MCTWVSDHSAQLISKQQELVCKARNCKDSISHFTYGCSQKNSKNEMIFLSGPGTVYDQQVLQWQVHIDRIGIMWQKPRDINGRREWWLHEAPWLGPHAHAETGSPLFWGCALKRNHYSSNKTVASRIPTEAHVGTPSCTPQDTSLQTMKDKEMKIKKMVATFLWKLLK